MDYYEEAAMRNVQLLIHVGATALLAFSSACIIAAQEPPLDAPAPPVAEPPTHRSDGRGQADVPVEAYAVVPGTKFLVRLEDELDTKEAREKRRFKVTTLEPLEAGSGIYLPAGTQIRGDVSRLESAGVAGRAKDWVTIYENHTKFATLPIVAEGVGGILGHSVATRAVPYAGVIAGSAI